jgi:3-deoxy-manno-octulosonate cytidylyltransferase (CMP-KDO synthetase)
MARALAIIPARYDSNRFPGKPLAPLNGKPMLQRVYEAARGASRLDDVWVATDDERIRDAVHGFGGRVVMTSKDHASGTDRVAEAARDTDAAIIINVQGDQPLISPEALDALVAAFDAEPDLQMATLYEPLASLDDLLDPNVVKVVADSHAHALYFSRSPIPFHKKGRPAGLAGYFKHVGVYAFSKPFLMQFTRMGHSLLESLEGLEQLRVLEAGHKIRLVRSSGCSISVEIPADIEKVQAMMEG